MCAFSAGPWPHHGGTAVIKLKALTTFLIERRLVLPELLDSWTNQVNLELI